MANRWKELPSAGRYSSSEWGTGSPSPCDPLSYFVSAEVVVVMYLVIESGYYILEKSDH